MRPTERDAAYLRDMQQAGLRAVALIRDRTYESLRGDWRDCAALERFIEVFGEAAGRVSQELRAAYPGVEWSSARGMRNVLAHDYDKIDYYVLYELARVRLPLLLAQISRLLDEVREVGGVYFVPRGVPLPMSALPMSAPRAAPLIPPRASPPSRALRFSRARA